MGREEEEDVPRSSVTEISRLWGEGTLRHQSPPLPIACSWGRGGRTRATTRTLPPLLLLLQLLVLVVEKAVDRGGGGEEGVGCCCCWRPMLRREEEEEEEADCEGGDWEAWRAEGAEGDAALVVGPGPGLPLRDMCSVVCVQVRWRGVREGEVGGVGG